MIQAVGNLDTNVSKHIDLKSSPLTDTNDSELRISDQDSNTSSSPEDDTFGNVVNQFIGKLNHREIKDYSDDLLADFNEALTDNSPISMLPNFNISPTGKEFGNYLVIDLGGSTLRISIIQITPPNNGKRSERINIVNEKKWIVANKDKLIDLNFFKFIGEKIVETINEQSVINLSDEVINVGITWSFPLNQVSHNSGYIVHVGKGWIISEECYNQDLKLLLQNAMKTNFDLTVDVKVIMNDSLAVYAAGKFLSSDLKLAMVLGTGFNTCCSIKITDKLHSGKKLKDEAAMLINCEMSLFGSNLFKLSNEFDGKIDSRFIPFERTYKPHMTTDSDKNVIFQPFEIMTSGRYLPELTRLSIIKLIQHQEIFSHMTLLPSNKLFIQYDGFSNELLCFISESEDLNMINEKFNQEFGIESSLEDVQKIKAMVDSIISRGSYTVTVAIVALIKLLKEHNDEQFENNHLTIGYVGSILVYFNNYRKLILKYINENEYIKSLNLSVEFMSIDDSSIVGAAVGAAYYN